jgi:O-antigen/teichoic acid export membrane protein
MSKSLKEQTISGMIWSAIQRFGTMFISFIANLVLARLLVPEDFGCIGMLMVFIAIANTFVDGGFGSALIQKENPTQEDYSTIFYWNLLLSVILFVILFFSAPFVAQFYKIDLLCKVLRVQGIVLIINAFCIIQNNQLTKFLQFKTLARINIASVSLGATIGILLAFLGFGVWSLVVRLLALSFTHCVFLWLFSKWKPLKTFQWESFKSLFNYGGLILLSNLVETIYNNVQALIIGRFFSSRSLGFYTQAKHLQEIPTISLSQIVNQVSFPVFSQLQTDRIRLKDAIKKNIKSITFLTFPLMAMLIVIAKPLILFLYTEKWISSVPYFQLLCVYGMLYTLNTVNTNIYKSIGRSDVFFLVQFSKRILSIGFIIAGLQFGIWGMMWAVALSGYLHFFINGIVSGKVVNLGLGEQIKDTFPYYILSIAAGIGTYYLSYCLVNMNNTFLLLVQITAYIAIYFGIAYLCKLEGFIIYYQIIKMRLCNKNTNE